MKRDHGKGARRKAKVPGCEVQNDVARVEEVIGVTKTPEEIIAEAVQAGIDLELVDYNLTLSPEERAQQHDEALRTVLALKNCGEEMRARDREAA